MKKDVKPKSHERVAVPPELRDAMRDVQQLIEMSERDGDVRINFDDAIQIGGLCGGRIGDKKRPFVFTWHLPGPGRCRWSFALHPMEVEDIAEGVMDTLLLYACVSPECQCKFRELGELCFHCDFVDDDPTSLHMMSMASTFGSKLDFVEEFLRVESQATWSRVLGVFQPIPGLGERVGWFSPNELERMIEEVKRRRG